MQHQQNLTVVGGTYIESCVLPYWHEVYGSGGRALSALLTLGCQVEFYSYLTQSSSMIIHARNHTYQSQFSIHPTCINASIFFDYLYPLGKPTTTALVETVEPIKINDTNANFLVFGMLEANAIVNGNKVVYDPQHPNAPKFFTDNGSSAKELALVLNVFEAKNLVSTDIARLGIEATGKALLQRAEAVIIKFGAEGVAVFDQKSDKIQYIPCYRTPEVWKIGTGDVFSASFAYAWITKAMSSDLAAQFAAMATAYYAHTQGFATASQINQLTYQAIYSKLPKTVYLAGPFFNLQQLWLVNEARRNLCEFGFKVFSPYHDIGSGPAEYVVGKDLEAIDHCDLLFALLDDMDPGTLFEIGYARARGKKVVIYTSQNDSESLKMMQGTDCLIFNELTTAIYNACWEMAS